MLPGKQESEMYHAAVQAHQTHPVASPFEAEPPMSIPALDAASELEGADDQPQAVALHASRDNLAFAKRLIALFADKGIRTSRAIILAVLPDGSVGVVGASPDKAKLEQLFVEDHDLFAEFHRVARQNDMVASAEICRRYLKDSYAAQGTAARMSVWRHYRGLCDQLEAMSGRLTLLGDDLMSGALQFTASILH